MFGTSGLGFCARCLRLFTLFTLLARLVTISICLLFMLGVLFYALSSLDTEEPLRPHTEALRLPSGLFMLFMQLARSTLDDP